MAKKYIIVRIPEETYNLYKNVKIKMESDLATITGKEKRLPMTKVFKAVVSPDINENYIQVDLRKLLNLSKRLK